MKEEFIIKMVFSVSPSTLYRAWTTSELHTEMTGGEATCGATEGDTFTAWDGYISGVNIEMKEGVSIHQSWRTTEFQDSDEDSKLRLEFKTKGEGCELVLHHSNIPEGQTQYEQGWINHYFNPMKSYFAS